MNRTFDPGLGLSVICDLLNTGGNVWASAKTPVKAATTANIALTGRQTIDGVALIDGDRVLVKDQTIASQNGIYLASTFGSWGRAADWDDDYDVVNGTLVPVIAGGTTNGGLHYAVTTTDPIKVGTTSVSFAIAFSAASSSFTPSGTAPTTRTVSSSLDAIARSGDYASTTNFNSRVVALTETIGFRTLQTAQTAELTGTPILEVEPVTSGFAPFEAHYNSFANLGAGAGTYNHATHIGYNVNRHSNTGTATSGKPSLIMGFEDNYFDNVGDLNYGMEWYIEYYSPDGTSVQQLRPFYSRMLSNNNTQNNCTTIFQIGTDGTGQFVVRTSNANPNLLVISGTQATVKIPFAVATSGGTQLNVLNTANAVNSLQMSGAPTGVGPYISSAGETNAPLRISSLGTGSLTFYNGFFSNALLTLSSTAVTSSLPFAVATSGGTQLNVLDTASAVNSLQMSGAPTGVGPHIGSVGEANAPLRLSSNGTGSVTIYNAFFTNALLTLSNTTASFTLPVSTTSGVTAYSGTAVPAGGTTGTGITFSSTSNLGVFFGSGAPTLSAAQGSLYVRTDGSSTSTRLYVNTNGTTGWTNVTTAT